MRRSVLKSSVSACINVKLYKLKRLSGSEHWEVKRDMQNRSKSISKLTLTLHLLVWFFWKIKEIHVFAELVVLSSEFGDAHVINRKNFRLLPRKDQGATYAVQLGSRSFVQIAVKDFAHAAQSSRALRARRFSANLSCLGMHSAPLTKITNASRLRPCETTQQAA